jgi:hypothetical protein
MADKFTWSDVDVILRKCAEVVLEGHRWVKSGCRDKGLSGPSNFKIACIQLRERLDKVIEGEPSNIGMT